MMFRRLVLAIFLAAAGFPAHADGVVGKLVTPNDKRRLAQFSETRKAALNEARSTGQATDVAVLDALVSKEPQSFKDFDLTGDWQCRTIKAGGPAGLAVYGWFTCRVTDDGSGWMLTKLSGSQRTTGRFYDDGDTRLIYLGAFSVNGEPAKAYGTGPASDQAGYGFRTGQQTWQIEFPAPYYESKFDFLELKR